MPTARTEKGRAVRLDQRLEASDSPAMRRWRQELAGSPFEKVEGLERACGV